MSNPQHLLTLYGDSFPGYFKDHACKLIVDPDYARTFAQAAAAMGSDAYERTHWWKHTRRAFFYSLRGRIVGDPCCAKCGSTENLQVHHLTYAHLGIEILHLEDLQLLCRECHATLHEVNGEYPLQLRLSLLAKKSA